jgi:hypothetical protein
MSTAGRSLTYFSVLIAAPTCARNVAQLQAGIGSPQADRALLPLNSVNLNSDGAPKTKTWRDLWVQTSSGSHVYAFILYAFSSR